MDELMSDGHPVPLSVLLVTNTFPTADEPGATPCVRDQVEALRAACGVQVDVLHIDRRRKSNYLWAALRLLRMNLGQRRYDLVHAHYGHSGFVAWLQRRVPLVVTFHGCDLLSPREGALGRWLARRVAGVIVMSEQMKRVSGRSDAEVIPFGVDTGSFYPVAKAAARSRLGLAQDQRYVLFPYDPQRPVKRFDVLTATVERLAAQGEPVEILTVHGQSRERMRDFMNAADLMVLTSDREGSPMAVREALVCGLPVVSVDVGDVAELLHGVDGCALARQDPADLARQIRLVLARDQRLPAVVHARRLDAAAAARQVHALYRRLAPAGRWIGNPSHPECPDWLGKGR